MSAAGSRVETEIKLRAANAREALARLEAAGFRVTHERTFESNLVFDTPDGSVRARFELIRLRRFGEEFVLTYKGAPVHAGVHKQREEIEVRVSNADDMEAILARMGLGVSLRYEKFRTELTREGGAGIATVDETPMGVYIELEGPADWIDATAADLGFVASDYITRSYLGLWEDHCRASGRNAGTGMVFD